MKRLGTRALAMAMVSAVVLLAGSSAEAGWLRDKLREYRETNRGERDWKRGDWNRVRVHQHSLRCGHRNGNTGPGPAVPEPSAALVFGVGLLVARGFARRNR